MAEQDEEEEECATSLHRAARLERPVAALTVHSQTRGALHIMGESWRSCRGRKTEWTADDCLKVSDEWLALIGPAMAHAITSRSNQGNNLIVLKSGKVGVIPSPKCPNPIPLARSKACGTRTCGITSCG